MYIDVWYSVQLHWELYIKTSHIKCFYKRSWIYFAGFVRIESKLSNFSILCCMYNLLSIYALSRKGCYISKTAVCNSGTNIIHLLFIRRNKGATRTASYKSSPLKRTIQWSQFSFSTLLLSLEFTAKMQGQGISDQADQIHLKIITFPGEGVSTPATWRDWTKRSSISTGT